MKFVIVTPKVFVGGGPLVLHVLCRELNLLGHDAKIYYVQSGNGKGDRRFWIKQLGYFWTNLYKESCHRLSKLFMGERHSFFRQYCYNPVEGCHRKWLPLVSSDTIVVYPDIFRGNILRARNVVRWLLCFNRFKDDENAYAPNDLFFCYREIFNDYSLNPDCKTITFNFFDSKLYKQINKKARTGCCYIVRKGAQREDLPQTFDGPVIDRWPEEKKVEAFNQYKYCYFYDTQTFYTIVAAVCGCIPIVVPEPGKTKGDYLGKGDGGLGVAYGDTPEEIDYAVQTRNTCIKKLRQFETNNRKTAKYFVDICSQYFKGV